MKKIIILFFCLVFIFLVAFIINYQLSYSVTDSGANIDNKIIYFLRNSKYANSTKEIRIKYQCNIDDRKYVLFYINKNLAYAELRRGLNSKYKIISVTADINMLRYEIIKTNKSKYLFVAGKNADLQIDYIKAKIGVDEYTVTIPKELYFISYCPVSSWASLAEDPSTDTFKVFDNKNNDITSKIRTNSPKPI
ncbi:hypothetical protein [Ruminiclostridium josui]|uniref:hypothetical protein n=1 Tax=Ruminiclostridium josui TaxID=1499 RepID=UPI000464EC4A|nr:hypothetical protein [Ruminiclostridium josui]